VPRAARLLAADKLAVVFEQRAPTRPHHGYVAVLDGCVSKAGRTIKLALIAGYSKTLAVEEEVKDLRLVGTRVTFVYYSGPGGIYSLELEQWDLLKPRLSLLGPVLEGGDTGYYLWHFGELVLLPNGTEAWVLDTRSEKTDEFHAQLFVRGARSLRSHIIVTYKVPYDTALGRYDSYEEMLKWAPGALAGISATSGHVSWTHENKRFQQDSLG